MEVSGTKNDNQRVKLSGDVMICCINLSKGVRLSTLDPRLCNLVDVR